MAGRKIYFNLLLSILAVLIFYLPIYPMLDSALSLQTATPNPDGYLFGNVKATLYDFIIMFFVVFVLANLPYSIVFLFNQKGSSLEKYVKKTIFITPIINSAIAFVIFGVFVIYLLLEFILGGQGASVVEESFISGLFYVSLFSTLSSVITVYFLQKYLVGFLYYERFFKPKEIKRIPFMLKESLTLKSILGFLGYTLLPLFVISVYVVRSENSSCSLGIITSIIMAILSGLFINISNMWSVKSQLKILNSNMLKTGKGNIDNFTSVKVDGEAGESAETFNLMSISLNEYHHRTKVLSDTYFKYVPKEYLRLFKKKSITEITPGLSAQYQVSVLVCDISGFTKLSQQLKSSFAITLLNDYFIRVESSVREYNGFVYKHFGDSLIAIFPISPDDAVNAAIEIHRKMDTLNKKLKEQINKTISVGIGIDFGSIIFGVVGHTERMACTAVSDTMNGAFRYQKVAKVFKSLIIVGEDVVNAVNDKSKLRLREIESIQIVHLDKKSVAFEVINAEVEDYQRTLYSTMQEYERGLFLYKRKKYSDAMMMFAKVLEANPKDTASKIYLERCQALDDNSTTFTSSELDLF